MPFAQVNQCLESERLHLQLIDDAKRGVDDILAGRTQAADVALAAIQQRRANAQKPRRT
jgi:hypothetical protein